MMTIWTFTVEQHWDAEYPGSFVYRMELSCRLNAQPMNIIFKLTVGVLTSYTKNVVPRGPYRNRVHVTCVT